MENKEKNFVSAVLYIHNAQQRIDGFLGAIMHELQENFEYSEIICVNDSSEDDSVAHIREMSKQAVSTSISVLNMSHFYGVEGAMNAGVDLAIGDFVFEFDSTVLDFAPSELMCVYRRLLQGYDIVSASPDKGQKASSNLFYHVFNMFADLDYTMGTERFRILSRRVINRINSMNKTVPYRKAIYSSCGLKTDNMRYPVQSQSTSDKMDKREKKYRSSLATDSLILFTNLGYRFSISMTCIMIAVTVLMALYAVIIYTTGTPVAGWTTTTLFLSFSFFGLFGILTIIIKYLQILVDLAFKRKRYNFESIEKLTK